MSAVTLPPPPPAVCLTRSYSSRGIRGGTVIAEDVLDLETHRQRLLDPDGYRATVGACRACRSTTLHALCFRERVLRGAGGSAPLVATVRLYRCAAKRCGAVFTVLPAVLARHLWRLWETVEAEVTRRKQAVPEGTRRRWLARLRSSATQLFQTLTARAGSCFSVDFLGALSRLAARRELLEAVRAAFAEAHSEALAFLSAWIHRLEPGIRVM